MRSPHVIFFRGLSTAGTDTARFSVFNLGPIHQHLERELSREGIQFHPVLNMGVGTLVETADRAQAFVEKMPIFQSGEPVHFVGHSAGGLVARMLMERFKSNPRILSCLTVATPNRGAGLARWSIGMPDRHRGSYRFLKTIGYDLRKKGPLMEWITPEGLAQTFGAPWEDERCASLVCVTPRPEWCPPLKLMYKIPAFRDFDHPSDGFVERDTQPFGRVIGEMNIDHFKSMGFFDNDRRLPKMARLIADYLKSVQR